MIMIYLLTKLNLPSYDGLQLLLLNRRVNIVFK